jgi:hypothetical protein
MIKKLLASIVASTCLLAGNALALPFQPNPQSFASYLNSLKWQDGKTRVFSNLRECVARVNVYECRYGYVAISDPVRGKIFCELQMINEGFNRMAVWYYNAKVQHGAAYPCRKA